jgi:pyruvate kinase
MSWGVAALVSEHPGNSDEGIWSAVEEAVRAGFASSGDLVVVIAGSPYEKDPVADTLRLVRVL